MNSNYFDKEKKKILVLFNQRKFFEVINYGKKLLKEVPNNSEIIRILGLTSINIQNFIDLCNIFCWKVTNLYRKIDFQLPLHHRAGSAAEVGLHHERGERRAKSVFSIISRHRPTGRMR